MRPLEEIEATANAATPGPWGASCRDVHGLDSWFLGWEVTGPPEADRGQFERGADTRFIAASRTDVPDLINMVRRLRAEMAARDQENLVYRAALKIYADEGRWMTAYKYEMDYPAFDTGSLPAWTHALVALNPNGTVDIRYEHNWAYLFFAGQLLVESNIPTMQTRAKEFQEIVDELRGMVAGGGDGNT